MAGLVFRQVDYPRYLPGMFRVPSLFCPSLKVPLGAATDLVCATQSGLWIAAGAQILTFSILLASNFYFVAKNKQVDAGTLVLENQPGFKYTL